MPKKNAFFLNKIQPSIDKARGNICCNNIILLRDFNSVLNNEYDIVAGLPHSKHVVESFNSLVNCMDLVDIWQVNNKKYVHLAGAVLDRPLQPGA